MKAHIFIDAENIKPEVCFKTVEKFGRDYTISRVDIIGNYDVISYKYRSVGDPYRMQNCYYGKNSADTWLCVEIAKTIFEESDVEVIIIVSSDRDFLPAIKLATEKRKSVILVSHGFGHRNFRLLLRKLKIDTDSVKLIDYRDGLIVPVDIDDAPKKKRSLAELMKNVEPVPIDLNQNKLGKFYSRLSSASKNFLQKREDKIKYIFIKHGQNLYEVPFIDGMDVSMFTRILHDLHVIGKSTPIIQPIVESLLYMNGKNVHILDEESIRDVHENPFMRFKGLSWESLQYFSDCEKQTKTIFIKHGKNLTEVPFVNGMSKTLFFRVLREMKVIGKQVKFQKIVEENFLKLKDDFVFLCTEDDMTDEEKDLLDELQEFFADENRELKTIFIKHDRQLHEVPFWEGIPLDIFIKILREQNIIGENQSIAKILDDSLLVLHDHKIYFSEDEIFVEPESVQVELENLLPDSLEYFQRHLNQIKFVEFVHNNTIYQMPFVDGMHMSIFIRMLHELQIIGKNCRSRLMLEQNGFAIKEDRLYFFMPVVDDYENLFKMYEE